MGRAFGSDAALSQRGVVTVPKISLPDIDSAMNIAFQTGEDIDAFGIRDVIPDIEYRFQRKNVESVLFAGIARPPAGTPRMSSKPTDDLFLKTQDASEILNKCPCVLPNQTGRRSQADSIRLGHTQR